MRGVRQLIQILFDMVNWLNKHFEIVSIRGDEVLLVCPYCHSPKLYFNVRKRIGQCKRAKCTKTPSLYDLSKAVGATLSAEYYLTPETNTEPLKPKFEGLPQSAIPLVELDGDSRRLISKLPVIAEHVRDRGVSFQDQMLYKISFDGNRIFIPIFFQGKMVQYISRLPWWRKTTGVKYLYAKGESISNFLFHWDIAKLWPTITLVENTFNSIWLKKSLNSVSNFGSSLSKAQIDLIAEAKAQSVIFLWDQGAEARAEKAVNSLRARGIPAAYCTIKGQPDDHEEKELIELVTSVRSKVS